MSLAALLAGIVGAAQRTGTTVLDGPHRLQLICWHAVTILLPVGFTVELKDFGYRVHDEEDLIHQALDLLDRGLFTMRGHVQVHGGRMQGSVTKVLLDQPQVDAGFKQMGRVAVA